MVAFFRLGRLIWRESGSEFQGYVAILDKALTNGYLCVIIDWWFKNRSLLLHFGWAC
jgi:hypothetical protein